MSNTIFSKIVLGEIPCDKVFEDDDHLAFLDIRPLSEGHTLVIPKKGYVDIFDMPSDEFGEFMEFVRFVALGVLIVGFVNILLCLHLLWLVLFFLSLFFDNHEYIS